MKAAMPGEHLGEIIGDESVFRPGPLHDTWDDRTKSRNMPPRKGGTML